MRSISRVTRVTRWLCLVGYALVASGLPLPIGTAPAGGASGRLDRIAAGRLAGKDRSRAFPCIDKPCGCATAEQCFTACCCQSPAETLAWARAHDVETAVLASLERRVAATLPKLAHASCEEQAKTCCTDKVEAKPAGSPSCCSSPANSPANPSATMADAAPAADDTAPGAPRVHSVVLRAMLACGGLASEWFASGGGLPPPPVTLAVGAIVVERIGTLDRGTISISSPPDAPPPRAASTAVL